MRISGYSGCADCQSHRAPTPTGGRLSVQANQSTKAELSLTTAEGDKVVISLSTASSAGLSAERSRSGANTSGDYRSLVRGSNSSNSNTAEINIQVEGNLNESELADIRKLAGIVSKASSDVLRGHAGKAAAGAAKASELATIQNFAFSLNRQIDYRYSYSGDNVT